MISWNAVTYLQVFQSRIEGRNSSFAYFFYLKEAFIFIVEFLFNLRRIKDGTWHIYFFGVRKKSIQTTTKKTHKRKKKTLMAN